jgi:hypothetical protein
MQSSGAAGMAVPSPKIWRSLPACSLTGSTAIPVANALAATAGGTSCVGGARGAVTRYGKLLLGIGAALSGQLERIGQRGYGALGLGKPAVHRREALIVRANVPQQQLAAGGQGCGMGGFGRLQVGA